MSFYRSWLVNHIFECELQKVAKQYAGGRLLDIGCGSKPYKNLFAHYVTEHVGVEHSSSENDIEPADIIADAYNTTVEDASFDTVLSTAVLEHLEEPEKALLESYRVLKPDGIAIYSVPFIWHLHEEPRDFFRFSKYGLKYLFEKTGFELLELRALGGFWVTFGQLFVYNLHRFNRSFLRKLHIIDAVGLLIQAGAYGLDKIDKTEQWTWMYLVVAKKK